MAKMRISRRVFDNAVSKSFRINLPPPSLNPKFRPRKKRDPATGGTPPPPDLSCTVSYFVESAAYTGKSLDFGEQSEIDFPGEGGIVRGMTFNDTGTRLYLATDHNETDDDVIYEYKLNDLKFDLGDWSYFRQKTILKAELGASGTVEIRDIFLSPDGKKMFVIDDGSEKSVHQYGLSTAFAITSASYDEVSFPFINEFPSDPWGLDFNTDGTKMFLSGGDNKVQEYNLGSPWRMSDVTPVGSFSVADEDTGLTLVKFSKGGIEAGAGLLMFLLGTVSDRIYVYLLGSAFDVSTAEFALAASPVLTDQDSDPVNFIFSPDGKKMFIAGNNTDKIYQYDTVKFFEICP